MSNQNNTMNANLPSPAKLRNIMKSKNATIYRAGTDTGSLVNLIMSAPSKEVPAVGMGVTLLHWTDRSAATVVEVSKSGKRIGIVDDITTRTDTNGMSDHQEYSYAPGAGPVSYFSLRRNGSWVREGESSRGGLRIRLGERDAYHDYSF